MWRATSPEARRRVLWGTAAVSLVVAVAGFWVARGDRGGDFVTAAAPPRTTVATTATTTGTTATTVATAPGTTDGAGRAAATPAGTTVPTPGSRPERVRPDATTTTLPAGTLTVGSPAADVTELQRQLNVVTGTALELHGVYDDATRAAVRNFQVVIGVAPTGLADPVTRWILAEAAVYRATLPAIGDGSAEGCQVAVIGDSLTASSEAVHVAELADVGCEAAVDGEGGRSLADGWQCRVLIDGRRVLRLFDEPIPGDATCAPSGLTLLATWAGVSTLGDIVVVALGTNDSGLFDRPRWRHNWAEAVRLAGGRPVVFLTTQALPLSAHVARQRRYSEALRQWCAEEEQCVLAEWAYTTVALDPASYVDAVHLTSSATRARAEFIADVVAALHAGLPIPSPPDPVTPPDSTTPPVTTTTPSTTSAPTTTTARPTPTTTPTTPTTTPPTTPTTPASTSTSSTTSTTTTTTTTIAPAPTTTLAG